MDQSSPRFRQDLVASAIEADGVPCVDVLDPRTGTKFRLYDFEYQLALQLNGQSLGEVTAWASTIYGVDLSAEGITEFAGRLGELGFLEADRSPVSRDDEGDAVTAVAEMAILPSGAVGTAVIVDAAEITDSGSPLDSAEQEWMSPQTAKTAQFVPDFAMLSSSPDRTPVAPELPILEALAAAAERTPPPQSRPSPAASVAVTRPSEAPTLRLPPPERSVAVTRPTEAPTIPSLPSAIEAVPRSAMAASGTMGEAGASNPRWALELDGAFDDGSAGSQAKPTPGLRSSPGPTVPPFAGPGRATATPAGVPERRQPPQPESVVMAGFSDGAKAPAGGAAPGKGPARAIFVLLLLAAAGVIGYFVWSNAHPPTPHAFRVRVLSPKPTAVYRWFAGRGVVVEDDARTIGFETPGRLAELLPAGTEFDAGEVLGRLQGSAALETALAHHRSRLGFYAQMRDSMKAAGNLAETRQAEIRLVEKQRLVNETSAELARVTLRPSEPGDVVETLAKVGAVVSAGAPIARVKGQLLHGEFVLGADDLGHAAELGFCRVEVIGLGPRASNAAPRRPSEPVADSGSPEAQNGPRFVDCTTPKRVGDKVTVALRGDLGLVPGQPLRLARQRYDAVFPVPTAAVGGDGAHRTLWVASRAGTAEQREVAVADVADDTLVSEGLRVGDDVIVEAPAALAAGALVIPERE